MRKVFPGPPDGWLSAARAAKGCPEKAWEGLGEVIPWSCPPDPCKWGFDRAQMSRNKDVESGVPGQDEHRHITQVLGTCGPWARDTGGIGRSWGWVQSQPGTPCSNTASPPLSGAAAAGGRCAGLPRPGPHLPALLLLLAVLPAAQERGAPGRRLLLHRLVRHHRHAGLQVSARGAAGPSGAWSDWKGRGCRAWHGRGQAGRGRAGRVPWGDPRPATSRGPILSQRRYRRGVLWQRGDQ